MTEIKYNGSIVVNLEGGQTATLHTTDKKLAGEIEVITQKPEEIKLQEKTATTLGEYIADSGYDGLSKVIVDIPIYNGETVAPLAAPAVALEGDTLTMTDNDGTVEEFAVYVNGEEKAVVPGN